MRTASRIFRAEITPPRASSNDNVSLNVTRQIHYVSRLREAHVAYEPGIKITCSVAPLRSAIDGRKSSTAVSLFMRRRRRDEQEEVKWTGNFSATTNSSSEMGKGGGHMTRFPRISLHATSPTFAHPFSPPRREPFARSYRSFGDQGAPPPARLHNKINTDARLIERHGIALYAPRVVVDERHVY